MFQDVSSNVFMIGTAVLPLGTPGISNDVDDVLALIDADNKDCQPNNYLLDRKEYRILLTSSPKKKEDRIWLKQRVGGNARFIMDLWSREELVVASLVHSA